MNGDASVEGLEIGGGVRLVAGKDEKIDLRDMMGGELLLKTEKAYLLLRVTDHRRAVFGA